MEASVLESKPIKVDAETERCMSSSPEESSEERQIAALLLPVSSVAPESPFEESTSTGTLDTIGSTKVKKTEDASETDAPITDAGGSGAETGSNSAVNSNGATRQPPTRNGTSEGFGRAAGLKGEGVRPAAKKMEATTLTNVEAGRGRQRRTR
jgi:hypothetical protein